MIILSPLYFYVKDFTQENEGYILTVKHHSEQSFPQIFVLLHAILTPIDICGSILQCEQHSHIRIQPSES